MPSSVRRVKADFQLNIILLMGVTVMRRGISPGRAMLFIIAVILAYKLGVTITTARLEPKETDFVTSETNSDSNSNINSGDTSTNTEQSNINIESIIDDANEYEASYSGDKTPEDAAVSYCKAVLQNVKGNIAKDTEETLNGKVFIPAIVGPTLQDGIEYAKCSAGYCSIVDGKASVPVYIEYTDYSTILKYTLYDYWDAISTKEYTSDEKVSLIKSIWYDNISNMMPSTGYETVYFELQQDTSGAWKILDTDDSTAESLIKVGYSGTLEILNNPDILLDEYLGS